MSVKQDPFGVTFLALPAAERSTFSLDKFMGSDVSVRRRGETQEYERVERNGKSNSQMYQQVLSTIAHALRQSQESCVC